MCCYCCNSSQGCQFKKRDFLKDAKFTGRDDISGQTFNKFVDNSHGLTFWNTIDSKQIPRKLTLQ